MVKNDISPRGEMEAKKVGGGGQAKYYILLHGVLLLLSISGIFSKTASRYPVSSPKFYIFYSLVLVTMGLYALLWQQVLKKVPLVTAFCNKAVTIIWGMLWGWLFFDEVITKFNILGAAIVIAGICLVVTDKK